MAILSSLFGSSQQQPAVGAQPIQSAEIPTELKPYYTDILGKAQALYNKRIEEGYKPYEGPTMAQFTPEQQATFTGIAGLQGQVAPKFAEAEQLTRDAAAGITGAQIQEAMSPYQQAVTDIEKRESQKAFEQNVLPKLRAAQVAQGSFGGTRGTLLEAQALSDQQRGLADIQTRGSAAAFQDARAALEAERTRMGQGATQLANIAPTALKTGLAELGAQQTVGEQKQQQSQTALDEAYRQFLQEKQEPYEAMQKYQAVVTGAPLTTTQFAQPPAPGPSLGQQLIGGLAGVGSLYGTFTGKPVFGQSATAKTGGGIAGLVKRAIPGQIVPQDELETAIGDVRSAVKQRQEGLKDIEQTYGYLTSPAYLQSKVLGDISQRILSPEANQSGNLLGAGLQILPGVAKTAGDTQKEIASLKVKLKQAQGEGNLEGAKAILSALKDKQAILESKADAKSSKITASSKNLANQINLLKLKVVDSTAHKALSEAASQQLGLTAIFDANNNVVSYGGKPVTEKVAKQIASNYARMIDVYNNTLQGKPFMEEDRSGSIGDKSQALRDALAIISPKKTESKEQENENNSTNFNIQDPSGTNKPDIIDYLGTVPKPKNVTSS